jgi:hypothetical protein
VGLLRYESGESRARTVDYAPVSTGPVNERVGSRLLLGASAMVCMAWVAGLGWLAYRLFELLG